MKLVSLIAASVLSLAALGGAARADNFAGRPQQRGELRQALLDRFDRNHDGRLEPNERRRAIVALRVIERRLARQERRAERREINGAVQRYDRNGDGVAGPGEVPLREQRRLRRLDRNGDGWVDGNDLR
jgi:hypothetical protein